MANVSSTSPLFQEVNLTATALTNAAEQLVFGFAGCIMVVVVVGSIIHRLKLDFLPESLVCVSAGALLGYALYYSDWGGQRHELDVNFQYALFSLLLKLFCLPTIIFESGWSLRQRDFFSQIMYILLIAILGTSISVVVVAYVLHGSAEYHGVKSWRTCLAYASLISSTDPVATLATFGAMNVDPLLFILVFGESQINDAVAITLFESINSGEISSLSHIVLRVFALLFGSLGLGIGIAMVMVMVMRFMKLGRSPHNALLFLVSTPFLSYTLAEQVGMSGIITVLFTSIVMGGYAPPHLPPEATTLASFLLKQVASVGDTIIFLCCGMMVVHVQKDGLLLSLWVMLACLVGRAAAVFPMSWLCNSIKWCVSHKVPAERRHFITWKHQVMLFHSGLRGGIGLVLSLELGEYVDQENSKPDTKQALVDATFVMICAYLLVFGGSTSCALQLLSIPYGDDVPGDASLYKSSEGGVCYSVGVKFRRNVLKPLLVGKNPLVEQHGVNLTAAVIQDAADREASSAFGLRRRSSVAILPDRRSSLALFGTPDPAHVEEVEDAVQSTTGSDLPLSGSSDRERSYLSSGEEDGFSDSSSPA